jgi:uncharacterized protein YbjT (DUF2867 family)
MTCNAVAENIPAADATKHTALVAGASGFVGGYLLEHLAAQPEFTRVIAVTRRPLQSDLPRLANRIVRFEALGESLKGTRAEVAFCALGTTLNDAGSREAFRRVDFDVVLAYARAAQAAGAQRFVLVSSIGADPGANNFYLRVKGETEEAVAALGFAALDIMQPGLLLGMRKELRPLELAASVVMPILNLALHGPAEKYRAIPASVVAAAMVGAARGGGYGVQRHTHREMRKLAARGTRR